MTAACRRTSNICTYHDHRSRDLTFKHFKGPESKRRRTESSHQVVSEPTITKHQHTSSLLTSARQVETATVPSQVDSTSSTSASTRRVQPLSIPFFRWFGPTGIAPGYKRFFVPIRQATEDQTELFADANLDNTIANVSRSDLTLPKGAPYFDLEDDVTPSSDILYPLLDTFFEFYACHFPFHEKYAFIASVRQKNIPAVLLNSICALAARFSDLPIFKQQAAYLRGEVYTNKAKHLLVPLLNVPSFEVLESILLIAWLELATCHDVGLWMYTGMAVRMAEDMGIHKVVRISAFGNLKLTSRPGGHVEGEHQTGENERCLTLLGDQHLGPHHLLRNRSALDDTPRIRRCRSAHNTNHKAYASRVGIAVPRARSHHSVSRFSE